MLRAGGTAVRASSKWNGGLIVGTVLIVSVVLFDVAWFSFREEPSSLDYQVAITPSSDGAYRRTIPTVVDSDGVELPAMDTLMPSKPANVTHVNASVGLALEIAASGPLDFAVRCLDCVGQLSYGGGYAVVRSNATLNFTLDVRLDFVQVAGVVETNVFGARNGGTCTTTLDASGSVPSMSNWTSLGRTGGTLCGDYFSSGSSRGLWASIPAYILAGPFLAVGARARKRATNGEVK